MSIDPQPIRELSDRLRVPEPAEISPRQDPLKAELEFLRLCRTQPEAARYVFVFAYGNLLEYFVEAIAATALQRNVAVTDENRDAWRRRLIQAWFAAMTVGEPQVLERRSKNWLRRVLKSLFAPQRRDWVYSEALQLRNPDGWRRTLARITEEILSHEALRIGDELLPRMT